MADANKKRWGGPKFSIDQSENSVLLEFGIGSEFFMTGAVVIQFDPSFDFVGNLRVMGRILGQVAENDDVPFVPIPYRLISLGGVANISRVPVLDDITQSCIIEIPISGLTGALLIACSGGTCDCYRTAVEGCSAQ